MNLPSKINVLIPAIAESILDLLEVYRDDILNIKEGIDAIALELIPSENQEFFALSFRQEKDYKQDGVPDENLRLSSPDWEHYSVFEYKNSRSKLFEDTANKIFGLFKELYTEGEEYNGKQQDINHLILLAATEALLDPRIAEKLRSMEIWADAVEGSELPYTFEYIIMDVDRPYFFNYAELVASNRLISEAKQRLNLN